MMLIYKSKMLELTQFYYPQTKKKKKERKRKTDTEKKKKVK